MLVIRLSKIGKTGEAKYRIVVKEKRSKRDGRPVDTVGYYEKRVDGEEKRIDKKKIKYWVEHGAQLSETVKSLL